MERLSLYEDFSQMRSSTGGTDLRHVRETYRALVHYPAPAPAEGIMLAAPHGPAAEAGTDQTWHWAFPPVPASMQLSNGIPALVDVYLEFSNTTSSEYTELDDDLGGWSIAGSLVQGGKIGGNPVPLDRTAKALRITTTTKVVGSSTVSSVRVSIWNAQGQKSTFKFTGEYTPVLEFVMLPPWDVNDPLPFAKYYMKGLPNVLTKMAVAYGTNTWKTVNLTGINRVQVPLTLVSNSNWVLGGGATDEVQAVTKDNNSDTPYLFTDDIVSSLTYSRPPALGLPRVYYRGPGLGTQLYTDINVGGVTRTTRHLISVNARPYGMSRDFIQDGNITVSTRKPDLFVAALFRGSIKTAGTAFSLAYLRDDIVNNQWEVGEIGRTSFYEVDSGAGPFGETQYGAPIINQSKEFATNLRLHLPSLLSDQYGYNRKFAIEFWFKVYGPRTAAFSPIMALGAYGYSRADGMAFEVGVLSNGNYAIRENYSAITPANGTATDGVWTFCRLSINEGLGQIRIDAGSMATQSLVDPNRPLANMVAYGGNAISHFETTEGSLQVYAGPMRVVYGDPLLSPVPSAPWPAP